MSFSLSDCRYSIIFGAGHGIGLAMVEYLLSHHPTLIVIATYRSEDKAYDLLKNQQHYPNRLIIKNIDPTNESHIKLTSKECLDSGFSFDLIINCVGLLHQNEIQPEKSLRTFEEDSFMKIMKVNCIVTPLIAKYFERLINKSSQSAFISLSAKVGSISDNRMGGWYSYRASKAALNMLIKTISIEFTRKKMNCIVLAIHPGTTKTLLSDPFIARTNYILHEPIETAANILSVIESKTINDTGKFYSWNNEELDW